MHSTHCQMRQAGFNKQWRIFAVIQARRGIRRRHRLLSSIEIANATGEFTA